MKIKLMTVLSLSALASICSAIDYNVVITKDNAKYKDVLAPVEELNFSSCKEILNNGSSSGSGIYEIENNSKKYNVYCDMVIDGGGWTMVFAQYENDISTSWNEGIQNDYDPSLMTNKSFALNTLEIPLHSQINFSQTNYKNMNPSDYNFNYTYTTGNIPKTSIFNNIGELFHIHRNESQYYVAHNPEEASEFSPTWFNTLTIDKSGGRGFSFAYSIESTTPSYRGYSYNGLYLPNSSETGAWVLWVR